MLLTIKDFINNFNKVIMDNKDNTRLIKFINKEFIKKGLNTNTILQLFEDNLDIEQLNRDERIGLATAMYIYFDYPILKPSKYFTSNELINYDLIVNVETTQDNRVIFKEVRRLNNKSYVGVINGKQAIELRNDRKFAYFKEIQRPCIKSKYRGRIRKRINLNREGVKELSERMLEHSILPTAITFSVLCLEGKNVQVKFNKLKGSDNLGDLIIDVDFDKESDTYTPLISNDGYHRLSGLLNATDTYMNEHGEYLNESLYCIINLTTISEAKQYVVDSLKHNVVKEEELISMKDNKENDFINKIISYSKILNNKVSNTYKDMKIENTYTYKNLLNETLQYTKFNLSNEIQVELQAERIAKIIDLIITNLNDDVFKSCNIFVGYFAIADIIKNDKDYIKTMSQVIEILELYKDEIELLDLKSKHCDIKHIYAFFEELIINNLYE